MYDIRACRVRAIEIKRVMEIGEECINRGRKEKKVTNRCTQKRTQISTSLQTIAGKTLC